MCKLILLFNIMLGNGLFIENLNRGIRKYTKTKVQFVDDNAVQKSVYLAIVNIEQKWDMPIQNWGIILHQFMTIFGSRCKLF